MVLVEKRGRGRRNVVAAENTGETSERGIAEREETPVTANPRIKTNVPYVVSLMAPHYLQRVERECRLKGDVTSTKDNNPLPSLKTRTTHSLNSGTAIQTLTLQPAQHKQQQKKTFHQPTTIVLHSSRWKASGQHRLGTRYPGSSALSVPCILQLECSMPLTRPVYAT